MDKVKANVPMMAFVIYLGKSLHSGVTSNDVAALLVLGVLYAAMEHLVERKELTALKKDIDSLKLSVKDNEKRTEEVKTHVGGLKMAQQMRPTQLR